jgi:crotonobetainyl-CoA:carnitine CoA-transferase CaiB-like acyl-CoA transferase
MVETTLLATALAFQGRDVMELPVADALLRGPARERRRELQKEAAPFAQLLDARNPMRAVGTGNIYYRTYKTKDGAIAVGALSPALWAKVRKALETDFLGAADPSANVNDPEWVEKARAAVRDVEERVASRTSAEWIEVFDREGVPAGPVQFPEDLHEDPQVVANDMMVDLEHDLAGSVKMVAPILKFSKTQNEAQAASPPLGRDTDGLLREAGFSDEEIAKMKADGAAV